MFGSARGFFSPLCTLSLVACSLEAPGHRDPVREPWPVVADAEAPADAAPVQSGPDAAVEQDAGLDAAVQPGPDAGAPDAAPPELDDATLPSPLADAAQDAGSTEDADTLTEAGPTPDAGGDCVLDGAFGVEVLFDVSWNATTLGGIVPLLEAGTGQIRVLARLDLRGGGLKSRALVTSCGATMPDFTVGNWLVGTEYYAAYIPESSWDQPSMPRWDLGWEVGCNQPGCSILTDVLAAVVGARSAAGDVWPGRTGSLSAIVPVDHDVDGYPAITMVSRDSSTQTEDGVPYDLIPVTWTLLNRATLAFVPFRVTGQFHGKLDTCDAFSGVVSNGSVEARCVGCLARPEGQTRDQPCSDAEASFLDANLPDWSVSGGTWRARRVPDGASCSAVRALMD